MINFFANFSFNLKIVTVLWSELSVIFNINTIMDSKLKKKIVKYKVYLKVK